MARLAAKSLIKREADHLSAGRADQQQLGRTRLRRLRRLHSR